MRFVTRLLESMLEYGLIDTLRQLDLRAFDADEPADFRSDLLSPVLAGIRPWVSSTAIGRFLLRCAPRTLSVPLCSRVHRTRWESRQSDKTHSASLLPIASAVLRSMDNPLGWVSRLRCATGGEYCNLSLVLPCRTPVHGDAGQYGACAEVVALSLKRRSHSSSRPFA